MSGPDDGNWYKALIATRKFVTPDDIPQGGAVVEIESVWKPNSYVVDEKKPNKPAKDAVFSFVGRQKKCLACKTFLDVVAMHHGPDPKAWVGKKIKLLVRYLEESFGDRNVPCIRPELPEGKVLRAGMRKYYGSPVPYQE